MNPESVIDDSIVEKLISAAASAREQAYAPYSDYKVGAALLAEDDSIYRGCNVENASYGLTICAERNAVGAAVLEGKRRFKAIAIVSDDDPPATPCGACRQVLVQFGNNIMVVTANLKGHRKDFMLSDLIPHVFDL